MFDRYTAKPIHQFIPFFMIIIAAVITGVFPSVITIAVFFVTLIGGLVTMIWIAIAGKIQAESEYWTNIGYDINLLKKSSPDIWYALRLNNPPHEVRLPPSEVVLESVVTGEDGESEDYAQKNFTINLSPADMQYMANELLSGKRTLAEKDWKFTPIGSTRVRKIKDKLKEAKLIEYSSPGAATQGFLLTQKGVEYFMRYASDWAKEEFARKREEITVVTKAPHPRPTDNGHTP